MTPLTTLQHLGNGHYAAFTLKAETATHALMTLTCQYCHRWSCTYLDSLTASHPTHWDRPQAALRTHLQEQPCIPLPMKKDSPALEKKEEQLHKDLDHDGEKGESKAHREKVLGKAKAEKDEKKSSKPMFGKKPDEKKPGKPKKK